MLRPPLFLSFVAFVACTPGPRDPEPTGTGTSGVGGSSTSGGQTGTGTSIGPGGESGPDLTGPTSTSTGPGQVSDTAAEGTSDVTATILTTGAGMHGQCGWDAVASAYACSPAGTPGAADPSGVDPIDCPPGLVVGVECDDVDGPISSVGCCQPDGELIYCDIEAPRTVTATSCGS